jgi:hypothetical protein
MQTPGRRVLSMRAMRSPARSARARARARGLEIFIGTAKALIGTATMLACLLGGSACAYASTSAPSSAASARRASAGGPSVNTALTRLQAAGAISQTAYRQYTAAYTAAQRTATKLTGIRRAELASVLSNVQQIAGAGAFTASRLPALFLTLERNTHWWSDEPLPANDQRVSFPPSRLVWQYYPGQGLEIQWLGTFGEANSYYARNENSNLRQLLAEAIPLATQRAGGIAWEYMFHFDGGSPPWTSGLSQGTGLQVLARAWSRFQEPTYLTAAQQALGVFQTAPPEGVRVSTGAGAEYAEYTYAPQDRILNGFIQALVGLYEYTSITKDPRGLALFEAGDAEARAEVPHYDTGAWSLYDQFGESDLNYHELLTEFLQHLCERTRNGPPIRQANAPIPGDAIYCTTARRFTSYLHTPPAVSLITTRLPTNARAGVQVSLSKISTVTITIRRGSSTVWTNAATVEGGKPRLLWLTPAQGGAYAITVKATDLAGNVATTSGTITLTNSAKAR